ncbi:MAG: hypothetical protein FWG48_01480 [Oscillospiraceae bacterium]|nr:hypothetical protein [Oscillospiraceae bacterium]
MNMTNDGSKYGVDQYRFAHNYEFEGKSFTVDAGGRKYALTFTGRDKLTFDNGSGKQDVEWECHKIEADTYFIRFGGNIAVFELAGGNATLALPEGYAFGTIENHSIAAQSLAHGFTDEMADTEVRWVFGCFKFAQHKYIDAGKCSVAWSPKEKEGAEHPAKFVKIKDGIYLVDITGGAPAGTCAPEGLARTVLLEDFEHSMFVGCVFAKDGAMAVSGYGEYPE